METIELIGFLVEKEPIGWSKDYKILGEIVQKLKEYDNLKKLFQLIKELESNFSH